MSSRAFAQAVTLINPGPPVRDKDNTSWLPGTPQGTASRADLWQLNTEQQVLDADGGVVADWEGIFPPGEPVTSQTEVHDNTSGLGFRVAGQPEARRSLLTGQPDHIGARLKFISDQQGAPS